MKKLIIVAAAVILGVEGHSANLGLATQNDIPSASHKFVPRLGAHETRRESQDALQFPNASENAMRVEAFSPTGAQGPGRSSQAMTAETPATAGLIIHATFDSSIAYNPNAAAIEATINRAIAIYESLFSDPITIYIYFRYSNTAPDSTPLSIGTLSRSDWVGFGDVFFVDALRADAKTGNDAAAFGSLPGPSPAPQPAVVYTIANARAVRMSVSGGISANGTVGGPYDGIVTLNSSYPFQFTRPVSAGNFDAQRAIEHEINEVMGLGSGVSSGFLMPQDLFSWSSVGVRNITSSSTRYFSINGGVTNIVNFNQNPAGDFGDWWSTGCPQAHPYVQNAFGCTGQSSDISATSPEGITLDVIGYDLVGAPPPPATARALVGDFNSDGHPDFVLRNANTRQTAVWYLNNNFHIGGAYGPTLAAGWALRGVADFNRDGHPDYGLFAPNARQTAIWYLSGPTFIGSAYGGTLPRGWELVATTDFNWDGKPDYVLYNPSTRQTAIWYLNNNVCVGGAYGPTLPAGWGLVGVADFDSDGNPDCVLFNPITGQTLIGYLPGITLIWNDYGPTVPRGWALVATADFDGDGYPDYLLYNASTRQTAIWYLNDNVFVGGAYGPTLPSGWSLVAP